MKKRKLKNKNVKKISKKIQPNQKKIIFLKNKKKYFFKKYICIKSINQIKILFLLVDSNGPP